ncbi:MAG TPA: transposase [Solirubrobacteraceae bacterium]|nr:transposase [Solirubrobacteraceae bacterium]
MSNGTRWVGIDLDRKRSHIAVIDEQGELTLSRRIVNDRDTFLELLGDPGAGTHVALEATYGWEWLAELLEEAGYDLHLAHPLRTRAIAAARVKTDAIDAKTLAHLLRTGFLPEAYVAPRELRELLRHRATLTRMRSAVKNRVHAILAKHGIAERAFRPVRQRRPRVPRAARAARRAAPAAGQPDVADLRLRPRDRDDHPRDRGASESR